MRAYRPGIDPDLRKGEDFWRRSLRWFSVTAWANLLAALFFLTEARPEIETFFDRYYNVRLRTTWNLELARYLFFAMVAGLVLSLLGLTVNLLRHRRIDDEYLVSLILAALLTGSGIGFYLYYF